MLLVLEKKCCGSEDVSKILTTAEWQKRVRIKGN